MRLSVILVALSVVSAPAAGNAGDPSTVSKEDLSRIMGLEPVSDEKARELNRLEREEKERVADCILDNLHRAQTKSAAVLLKRACETKARGN